MFTQLLAQIVGWLSLPVLAVLAGILVWRRALRAFPHFFNYVVINELVGLARLLAYHAPAMYGRIYWISDVLIAIFAFLATYELFAKRLFPRFSSVRFYHYLFPAAATVVSLVAVPPLIEMHRRSILLMTIHVFDVLRVAILFFFVGLMVFMGRRWTRYEFGIAMGLVVEASALLMTSVVWPSQSFIRHAMDQLPVIAYDIACLIWLITFLKQEKPEPVPSVPVSPEVLKEARKWEETLKGSLSKKKSPD